MLSEKEKEMEEEFEPLAQEILSIVREINFSAKGEEEEEVDENQPLI